MVTRTNLNGTRIAYEYPHGDALNQHEKELHLLATEKAENALTRICNFQKDRMNENDEIENLLLDDQICEMWETIDQLHTAITILNLTCKKADWADRMAKEREIFREKLANGECLEEYYR